MSHDGSIPVVRGSAHRADVPAEYQPPMLTPVGNLNDVVASTTQHLACDGGFNSGTNDGDSNMC